MSELIVGKITPPAGQPLVIDGQRTIKVDVIQDYQGETKTVSKLACVHPEADASLAVPYEFVYYASSGVLSFKTESGFVDIRAINTPVVPEGYQEFNIQNVQVLDTWQQLPINLNMYSGSYVFQATAIESSSNRGIYSGVMPFLNKADQSILSDSIQQISVARIGEDSSVLEFRLNKSSSLNDIKLEFRGSVNSLLPYKNIIIKLRSML